MDIQKNILGTLEQAPRQAAAMAQRAQALQADASFWKPGEEPNKFKCLPLWQAICIFKGMDPAHWALTSPVAAASLERYTTGEVAARLKELVQLHTLALSGITMGRLKAPGNETKGFETDMVSLIEWAALVGEALPAQYPVPDVQSTPQGLKALKVHTTKGKRSDTLTPVIEHAQSLCKNLKQNEWGTAEVWGQLHTLTAQNYTVLLHLEGDSVVYTDGDNTKKLNKKSLGDRLKRMRERLGMAL